MAGCGAASSPGNPPFGNRSTTTYELLPGSQSGLGQVPLTITSARKVYRFDVELARSEQEQAIGMMFRRRIPADRGMLFPYDPPQPVAFWMKNTLEPLDLLFIGTDRRILNVATGVPESLAPIASAGAVVAVLEIAGGRAAELGIAPGDRVDW